MKRLDKLTRAVEQGRDPFEDVGETIVRERALSHEYGGRTVFDGPAPATTRGKAPSREGKPSRGQLTLFPD
jgi:hypothetical protein